MRMGIVRGNVVLSPMDPSLIGTRFLIIEVVTADRLCRETPGGSTLIVADHLSPAVGQTIGFVEGREAANPYWPGQAPVDAYCSLIAEGIDFEPGSRSGGADPDAA